MALCEHEELASLTHTKPKTAPAHVPRWKRKQEQAAAAGLKTNHTGQTVNTPNKKPKASPSKAAAAAPSTTGPVAADACADIDGDGRVCIELALCRRVCYALLPHIGVGAASELLLRANRVRPVWCMQSQASDVTGLRNGRRTMQPQSDAMQWLWL